MVMGNLNPFTPQVPQQMLGQMDDATLVALAQQGNPQFTHAALLEQAAAQRQMMQIAQEKNIEVPKVNFYPSRHGDARKARKQDIKQAYKLLKPTKRSILDPRRWLGSRHRYNHDTGMCVVDGCNVKELIMHNNLYASICDEETGRSLWEMYWQNPVTGEAEAFIARDGVTSGRKMIGTYCPEHLHLYHLLCRWEDEQERELEMQPSRFRDKIKRGVSFVTVPVATIAPQSMEPLHPLVTKYEPFFAEISADSRKSDGINISHYTNPLSGENDLTTITFDMRLFKKELLEMQQPTQAFQEVIQQQAEAMAHQQTQVQPPVPPTVVQQSEGAI